MTDWDLTPKPVSASHVTLVQLMEITDANIMGIVHGGVIMKLVDTAAGLASFKHIAGLAVTVSVDEMSFLAPVRIGDTVTVKASVNDVGETSLEVGVRVEAENVLTGERRHVSSAYLVFVALDDKGRPRPVPPIIAETPSQLRRQREATMRRRARLAHKAAIAEHRRDAAPAGEPPGSGEPPPAPDGGGPAADAPEAPDAADGTRNPPHLRR